MMTPEEQKAFFEDRGYLVVEDVMSSDELVACEAEIRHLHKMAAEMAEIDDARLRNFQREPYAKDKEQDGLPVLRKIEQTRDYSGFFKNLAAHPNLVPVVQNLIGLDLLLFRSTLMLKPAFHGSSHGFHQDSAYWPMEPPSLVTVSIALTDSDSENGCIQVILESHKWGMQKWGNIARPQGSALTDRDDVDTSRAIEVPLKAGSALFFHSLSVHGSGPNNSPRPRHTALYAYFPPTVRYIAQGKDSSSRTFPVIAGLEGREEITMVAEPAA
jgi:phytanoyl-CoA hydroxylase